MAYGQQAYGSPLAPLAGQAADFVGQMQNMRFAQSREQRAAADEQRAQWEFSQQQRAAQELERIKADWAASRGDLKAFMQTPGGMALGPEKGMEIAKYLTGLEEQKAQRESLAGYLEGYEAAPASNFSVPGRTYQMPTGPAPTMPAPAGLGAVDAAGRTLDAEGEIVPFEMRQEQGGVDAAGRTLDAYGEVVPYEMRQEAQAPTRTVQGFVPRIELMKARKRYQEANEGNQEIRALAPLARVGTFDQKEGDVWKQLSDMRTAKAKAAADERKAEVQLYIADLKLEQERLRQEAADARKAFEQDRIDERQLRTIEAGLQKSEAQIAAALKAAKMRIGQAEDRATAVQNRSDRAFRASLTRDYKSEPIVKSHNIVAQMYSAVRDVYNYAKKSKNNLASDNALVTQFTKMIDPTSVVMPSEFLRTVNFQSLQNKVEGFWQKVQKGGPGLTQADRDEIVKVARILLESSQRQKAGVDRAYAEEAESYGIPPPLGIRGYAFDEGTGTAPAVGGAAPAPATGGKVVDFKDLPRGR